MVTLGSGGSLLELRMCLERRCALLMEVQLANRFLLQNLSLQRHQPTYFRAEVWVTLILEQDLN